jgi:hypothetical protein
MGQLVVTLLKFAVTETTDDFLEGLDRRVRLAALRVRHAPATKRGAARRSR